MGGFVSRIEDNPITTLTQLTDPALGQDYEWDIQSVEREDIIDKSKADGLAKGIALLQGLWFVTQIFVRFAEKLPTSQLEVATLAYAVVNIFTWLLWWHKPLDVQKPIRIGPTKKDLLRRLASPFIGSSTHIFMMTKLDFDAPSTSARYQNEHHMPSEWDIPLLMRRRNDRTRVVPDPVGNTYTRTTEKSRPSNWHRVVETFFSGPIQGTYAHYRPGPPSTAVPEFWSSPDEPRYSPFVAMLVGMTFGAIHCASWTAVFPSALEMHLWRTSAVVVAVYPATLLFPHLAGELLLCPGHVHAHIPNVVRVVGIGLYVGARAVLIVLSGTTLRAMASGWFRNVDWTVHIPHLGVSI